MNALLVMVAAVINALTVKDLFNVLVTMVIVLKVMGNPVEVRAV